MRAEDYTNRKEYIRQIKESFHTYPYSNDKTSGRFEQPVRYASNYDREDDARDTMVSTGSFKWRFVLAVCLFLGFLAIRQTNFSYEKVSADSIVEQIQREGKVPEKIFQELKAASMTLQKEKP